MPYGVHSLPPDFYLSHPGRGLIMEFTDVQSLVSSYSSTPNIQPLLGMNAPYISEGHGNGTSWDIDANLNPFHAFLGEASEGGIVREGGTPYDELLLLKDIIEVDGPTPLFILHRPKMEDTTVALYALDDTVFLQESERGANERFPTVIPMRFSLIERRAYKVTVF